MTHRQSGAGQPRKTSAWPPFFILIFPVLFVGTALATFGPFQDTEIYFLQFIFGLEDGLEAAITADILTTGKIEPGLMVLLSGLWALDISSPEAFLFFGYFIVTGFCLMGGLSLCERRRTALLIFSLISYWIVSRNLYFWRASIAYSILIIAYTTEQPLKKTFAIAASIAFHYSAIVFISIFVFYKLFIGHTETKLAKAFLLALILSLVVRFGNYFPSLDFIVSRGNLDPYTAGGLTQHSLQSFLSIGSALTLLILSKGKSTPKKIAEMRLFFIFLLASSLLLIDYYHLSSRIAMPALLFSAFLAAGATPTQRLNRQAIVALLVIASLPTLRLVFMMTTGTFDPQ